MREQEILEKWWVHPDSSKTSDLGDSDGSEKDLQSDWK